MATQEAFPYNAFVQVRAAAFDIDGTLYPNSPMLLLSALHAIPRLRFLKAFARARKQIRRIYPIEDFRGLQNRLVAESLGVTESCAETRIKRWLEVELDGVYRRLSPFPYVSQCLDALRRAGLKTAVMSDFPIGNKLDYLGLADGWDCRLSSEDSGYLKPRAEPFAMLAECLDELPEHIVYIGNSYEYDIIGARHAGMQTAYLSRGKPKGRDATISFSSYHELAPKILEFVRS